MKKPKNRPSKCPCCRSSRIEVIGTTFYCRACGFLNKKNPIQIRRR